MIKLYRLFLLLLTLSIIPLRAELSTNIEEKSLSTSRDEVEAISQLIQEQQRHLDREIELKELMQTFQLQKGEFAQGKQTQKHAIAMVSTAREILAGINEEHIAHLFPAEYLEELVFFSSVAGKSKPNRP
jgi:GTP1/Obg family GTP-binding protein